MFRSVANFRRRKSISKIKVWINCSQKVEQKIQWEMLQSFFKFDRAKKCKHILENSYNSFLSCEKSPVDENATKLDPR